MVIGLYGTWGVGKTSLMLQIREKLEANHVLTVWFDAWQHQFDDSPALALMHTVVDTFGLKTKREVKKLLGTIAGAFGSVLLNATTGLKLMDLWKLGERIEEEQFEVREARARLHHHFRELIEKAQGEPKRRIAFFIDDLDRCMPPQTLSML